MITNNKNNNAINEMQYVVLDQLVPQERLVRKIDKVIDFEFIRDKVKHLYSDTTGRQSIDPLVLFKIVFIQFMFGIKSMRQTIKEIEVNMAYRWFLKVGITDEVPHFSTFGKNYKIRADCLLNKQIDILVSKNIPEFYEIYKMLINWKQEIINSFNLDCNNKRINNSVIEGRNKIIKQIIDNANGVTNFYRLRNRIMYCINNEYFSIEEQPNTVKRKGNKRGNYK